jgi:uncharacterized membrane protein YkoI
MKRHRIFSALALAALLLETTPTLRAATLSGASPAHQKSEKGESRRAENKEKGESNSQDQAQLAREAKITMEQARSVALKRASGTIESSELEREHGQLVYSFDIRNAKGTITEVQVNAITGKIARIEHENKKQEAAEKRQEKRSKHNPTNQ